MKSRDLRQKFLDYFKEKDHTIIASSSLVPENDPTVLFTTAGMFPLIPYLLGEKHPHGSRLTDAQKCIRTDDIEEVGDKIHHTFFEMMGNWSFGDYFKAEAIEWSFEFLTSPKWLNIPLDKLAFTVFAGDDNASFDQESHDKWLSLGVKPERIAQLSDNWWKPGDMGPCGPDSEMFFWTGSGQAPLKFDPEDERWVEIWNDVFMQFNRNSAGKLELLKQQNVDTGMGFERALSVLNGSDDNYTTDLFWPIIMELEKLTGLKYGEKTDEQYIREDQQCWVDTRKKFRIIADHLKAAVFAINDGIVPSNKERGYIIRRLIRRAIVKVQQLEIKDKFVVQIAEKVFEIYDGIYEFDCAQIVRELDKEEVKFSRTLKDGLKLLDSHQEITGQSLFNLYQSFGLPLEISLEEANRREVAVSEESIAEFNTLLRQHQELSRTASAGMFKGGLADAGEITTKYHTATHLLLAALRQVLGQEVFQKGSNITAERMRFDFSYPDKMTPAQISAVETIVNEKIAEDLPVDMVEMSLEDAKACGAMGVFESKYSQKVKVYSVGSTQSDSKSPFSREICGGPHISHTGALGHFKIQKEESSSAGVRRIKAILE